MHLDKKNPAKTNECNDAGRMKKVDHTASDELRPVLLEALLRRFLQLDASRSTGRSDAMSEHHRGTAIET